MNPRTMKPVALALAVICLVVTGVTIASAVGTLNLSDSVGSVINNPAPTPTSTPNVVARKISQSQKNCEASGGLWTGQGCANKNCKRNGQSYGPGSTIYVGNQFYMCDGISGEWVQVGLAAPTPTPTRSSSAGNHIGP